MKSKLPNFIKGFSLVEMIIYIAILAIIFNVVIGVVLSFSGSYRNLSMIRLLDHSATESMERMTRDIRFAKSVDLANSTLGTNPGILTITSQDGAVITATKFYVQNNILNVDVNGANIGPLVTSKVSVTNLIFRKLTTTNSTAVKVDMTLQTVNGTQTQSKSYHDTIVLKGQ